MNSRKVADKLAKQLDSIRSKKIQAIKSRISEGKYQVNNLAIAKALFLAR